MTSLAKSLKTLQACPDPNLNSTNCVIRENPYKKSLIETQDFLTSTSILKQESVGTPGGNKDIIPFGKKKGIFCQKSPMKGLTKNSYSPKAENKNDYFEDAASDKKVIRDV